MKILSKGEYYGTMKLEHQFNGIILSEYDYITQKTDWHFHENPYLMYLLKGDVFDINKKTKEHCSSGTLLLHNWQEPHFNEKHSDKARGFHIEFDRNWFKENKLDINLWKGSQVLKNPNAHHIIAKLYFEFKCLDIYSNISIELLLMQLCESIADEKKIHLIDEPLWVKSLREILDVNKEQLSLKKLSELLNIHPAHLSRAVPKYFKTTLGDYIRKQKIKLAINYLLKSKFTLTEITYMCGFSDQSHFIRVFKLYIGVTPSQFRNNK